MKTKQDLRDLIMNQIVTIKDVRLVKIYGLFSGIGYDINIEIVFNMIDSDEQKTLIIPVHAMSKSDHLPGHLRSNQVEFDNYKGSRDSYYYWDSVKENVSNEKHFVYYLEYLNKTELLDFIERLTY